MTADNGSIELLCLRQVTILRTATSRMTNRLGGHSAYGKEMNLGSCVIETEDVF